MKMKKQNKPIWLGGLLSRVLFFCIMEFVEVDERATGYSIIESRFDDLPAISASISAFSALKRP
jgi:hypothetical protein